MDLREATRVLQLPKKTTLREAKAAYRRLAKKYHPDVNSQEDASRFLEVVAAYEYLKEYVAQRKRRRRSASVTASPSTANATSTGAGRIAATSLVVAQASPWLSRKAVYDSEFRQFVEGLDDALKESVRILYSESERFCERVFEGVVRRIDTYSDASKIRSKLHRDVNQILRREGVAFLGRLSEGPRRVVTAYDGWLTEMRVIARKHSLRQTMNEYLSSGSGLALSCTSIAVLVPTSILIAAACPYSLVVGLGLIGLSSIGSLWGSKAMYRRSALKRIRQTTTTFLSEAGLRRIDRTMLPMSKERTRDEQADQGALGGMMLGWFALGPLAGAIGAVIGGLLGGMSGREFEDFRAEVRENTLEGLSSVLDDFLDKTERQLRAERQSLIHQMRQNFIANLSDEKLTYGL